jgi:tRNA threonylcarbamoyladenosine biosynthesis protein TsaE
LAIFAAMELLVESLESLEIAAKGILSFAENNRTFLFYGEMGVGKTTLIKSLCLELGSTDNISSPTFALVNEYTSARERIYHFDMYRLKSQNEAFDFGFEEYLYSGNYCFIEWPEKIPGLLPDHYISVKIKVQPDNSRHISVEKI